MAVNFASILKRYVEEKFNRSILPNERITLSIDEIRQNQKSICLQILENPLSFIPIVEDDMKIKLSFIGSFGQYQYTPSTISSDFLGKMVKVEGIITSLSNIKLKLRKSVHEQNNTFYAKEYRDATTLTSFSLTNTIVPQTLHNESLNFEYCLSTYIDIQRAAMQEMPENTRPGAMPRSLNIIIGDDLTGSLKLGDGVFLTGIYKTYCYNNINFPNFLPTALIVNNVENKDIRNIYKKILSEKLKEPLNVNEMNTSTHGDASEQDSHCGKLESYRKNYENAVDYVAPFIYISNDIKKAILLQMIESENKVCRKSINILLLGDPSTAKSQILWFVINTINAISTSGKGSTGVGLTASIVSEKNERRLEAGAVVLADNSVICIDEFDKINHADAVVLHEVMEQESISMNKAGKHVTLNARTAVLAAANPVYGCFTDDKLGKQIKIPESLLSRFDLIFLLFDDGSFDAQIAEQVLSNHSEEQRKENVDELREFIFECKKIIPKMSKDAAKLIAQHYVDMRKMKTRFPVTQRLLDSLIRLSNSHARLRKSTLIEEYDVNEVFYLIEKLYQIKENKQYKRMKIQSPI